MRPPCPRCLVSRAPAICGPWSMTRSARAERGDRSARSNAPPRPSVRPASRRRRVVVSPFAAAWRTASVVEWDDAVPDPAPGVDPGRDLAYHSCDPTRRASNWHRPMEMFGRTRRVCRRHISASSLANGKQCSCYFSRTQEWWGRRPRPVGSVASRPALSACPVPTCAPRPLSCRSVTVRSTAPSGALPGSSSAQKRAP